MVAVVVGEEEEQEEEAVAGELEAVKAPRVSYSVIRPEVPILPSCRVA